MCRSEAPIHSAYPRCTRTGRIDNSTPLIPFLAPHELIELLSTERHHFRDFRGRHLSRSDGTKCRQSTRWRVGELLTRRLE